MRKVYSLVSPTKNKESKDAALSLNIKVFPEKLLFLRTTVGHKTFSVFFVIDRNLYLFI